MENNNQNPNTGAKGVFPGAIPNQVIPQTQNGQPVQNTQTVPSVEQQPIQNMQPTLNTGGQQNQSKTFIHLETSNAEGQVSGILEIDLISFRHKGEESRYLSMNLVGSGPDGNQSETTISISNEAEFNRFKKFISELQWND